MKHFYFTLTSPHFIFTSFSFVPEWMIIWRYRARGCQILFNTFKQNVYLFYLTDISENKKNAAWILIIYIKKARTSNINKLKTYSKQIKHVNLIFSFMTFNCLLNLWYFVWSLNLFALLLLKCLSQLCHLCLKHTTYEHKFSLTPISLNPYFIISLH